MNNIYHEGLQKYSPIVFCRAISKYIQCVKWLEDSQKNNFEVETLQTKIPKNGRRQSSFGRFFDNFCFGHTMSTYIAFNVVILTIKKKL